MKNSPYVKQYNEIGVLLNPITKDDPFLNYYPKKKKVRQPKNNSKGQRVLIVNYGLGMIVKYHVKQQLIKTAKGFKSIFHYVEQGSHEKALNKLKLV